MVRNRLILAVAAACAASFALPASAAAGYCTAVTPPAGSGRCSYQSGGGRVDATCVTTSWCEFRFGLANASCFGGALGWCSAWSYAPSGTVVTVIVGGTGFGCAHDVGQGVCPT